MFNRSIKYIILIVVIIIVFLALYLNGNVNFGSESLTPEQVAALEQKERDMIDKIDTLNTQVGVAEEQVERAKTKANEQLSVININEQKLLICENEQARLSSVVAEQAEAAKQFSESKSSNVLSIKKSADGTDSSTNCAEVEANLSQAQNELKELQQRNRELRTLVENLNEIQANNQVLLSKHKDEVAGLKQIVAGLERDLSSPIYLKQNYIGARYCDKPKFESLICVVEFLVRPTFSKLPVNELEIKVLDSKGIIVAQGQFASAQKQMYRMTLGRGAEVTAGDFTVEYNIDNQKIVSDKVPLVQ